MGKAADEVGFGGKEGGGFRNSVLNMSCLKCLLEMLRKEFYIQIDVSRENAWLEIEIL